jgi:hypothetical protein
VKRIGILSSCGLETVRSGLEGIGTSFGLDCWGLLTEGFGWVVEDGGQAAAV